MYGKVILARHNVLINHFYTGDSYTDAAFSHVDILGSKVIPQGTIVTSGAACAVFACSHSA